MTTPLVPADTSRAGVTLSGATACAALGDSFLNSGRELMVLTNASVAPIDVTFVTQDQVDGRDVGGRTVTIAAGATVAYGPFPPGIYNDTGGYVQVTYTDVTTLTAKVVKVTPA